MTLSGCAQAAGASRSRPGPLTETAFSTTWPNESPRCSDRTSRIRCLWFASFALLVKLSLPLACATAATLTVTNTADSGAGSFRSALTNANGSAGGDRIVFNLAGTGVHTISLVSPLPTLGRAMEIDGTTQPGYTGSPLVELNGSSAGNCSGLKLSTGASGSTVRGLAINRFGANGIEVDGATNVTIQSDVIGTDPTGTVARPNALEGIYLNAASGNLVGGTNAACRNLISGNGDAGIYVLNASGNSIQGNYIGTTLGGTGALGNGNNGITIYATPGSRAVANQVGGSAPGAGNLVSGNRASGLYLFGAGTVSNQVMGNLIGAAVSGSVMLSNAADGITLQGAAFNIIGGTKNGEGNLVSGNGQAGIFINGATANSNLVEGNLIGSSLSGRAGLGNGYAGITILGATGNRIGGSSPAARNVISANRQDGVLLSTNSTANMVEGNLIGTDISGTNALPNGYNGIALNGASSNLVGGAGVGSRNVISGNLGHGILLTSGAATNSVSGNFIGVDGSGAHGLANRFSGVRVESAGNYLGGSPVGAGNVISGNGDYGLLLFGSRARGNLVQGNLIGTTAGGGAALANGSAGIGILGAPDNLVGSQGTGCGNLISGNTDAGVYVVSNSAAGNRVLGNILGATLAGSAPLPNAVEGIYLESCPSNVLGGDLPGMGNLVSGNSTRGIFLTNSPWTVIQGNLIGTRADGLSPLPNVFHNIECEAGVSNTTIGGSGFAANRIAFAPAPYCGVRIRAGSVNNRIDGNAIFANGGLGIDLGPAGVTANDACDADTGANLQQNSPTLSQAVSGSNTGVRGTLNSTPLTPFLLQFFANAVCDPSGSGEGQIYLGDVWVTTSASCTATFLAELTVPVPAGYVVTSTATDPAGNTSEFSGCQAVVAVPKLGLTFTNRQVTLSWSNSVPGFVLERTDSLAPPIRWQPVTNSPVSNGGRAFVSFPLTTTNSFFVLRFE